MLNRREFWGFLILLIGAVLLVNNLDFLDYSVRRFLRDLWPVILIIIGIALIVRHTGKKSTGSFDDAETLTGSQIPGNISKVFGDLKIDLRDREADSLTFETTFGDIDLNLAGAKLKTAINRMRVSGVFGDITIIVPGDMEAFAYGATTFGDVHIFGNRESGISNRLQNQTENYDSAVTKIHISANTTFGDVKIYRA